MKYVAGLDGLRAVAVISVLAFHGEFSIASGGFLGVSLFFTLSGFLITTLLLDEHESTGTLSLRRFYGRRVRRLLPAAYVCLLLVVTLSVWWTAGQLQQLPGDLLGAVANVANWRYAFSSASYQDLFLGEPSPVAHFWSLAVEEQIYLMLPVLALVALRRGRRTLAVATGALLAASFVATLLTSDRDLVYNGTHTRAAELIVGVALAQVLRPPRGAAVRAGESPVPPDVQPSNARRRAAWLPGALGCAAFLVLVVASSVQQAWVYRGGLVGVALISAVLIAAVARGDFPANLLAARPLVAIGAVSYGIYLFHWPVFLLVDEERTGLGRVPLFGVRCALTAVLAVGSYVLIEQPIRRGRVVGRNRVMIPVMMAGAVAVVIAALLIVPAPNLTPTEGLLALGDEEVVDFAAMPDPISAPRAAPNAAAAAGLETGEPTSTVAAPVRVAVLGSDPMAAVAIRGSSSEFEVVEDTRSDCPLSSVGTPGCERLVDRWTSMSVGAPVEVLVLVTNTAEAADVLGRRLAAVNEASMVAFAASNESALGEILVTIDAAREAGTDVVWYSPADPASGFEQTFSRVGLERADARTVVGGVDAMTAAVGDLVAQRTPNARVGPTDDALRVLVIGDSTSLNFAAALHDGSDGRISVLWAGRNGCPLAVVRATRPSSRSNWVEPGCPLWDQRIAPLVKSFRPDALFVMTGPTELQEHRFPGDEHGWEATDPAFVAARDAQLEALLAVVGPDVPVLVADLPAIAAGAFSTREMTSPERLAAVNAQVYDWDQQRVQVARFPYREALEAAEAARPADDPIRSDGTHPDNEPLRELARDVYVDEFIGLVDRVRVGQAAAIVLNG